MRLLMDFESLVALFQRPLNPDRHSTDISGLKASESRASAGVYSYFPRLSLQLFLPIRSCNIAASGVPAQLQKRRAQ